MVTIDSPRRFLCIRQHSYCQEGGSPANSMKVVKRVEVRNQLSGFPSRKRCAYGRGCEYRRCRIDKLTIKTRANLGTQEGNGDAWECVKGADWVPVARPAVKAPRYVQTQKGMPSFIDPIPADPCPDCQGSGKTTCGVCRGKSRLNYRHLAMLPAGVSIEWCPHCRGTGRWFCSGCMGTGQRREPIGFRLDNE